MNETVIVMIRTLFNHPHDEVQKKKGELLFLRKETSLMVVSNSAKLWW